MEFDIVLLESPNGVAPDACLLALSHCRYPSKKLSLYYTAATPPSSSYEQYEMQIVHSSAPGWAAACRAGSEAGRAPWVLFLEGQCAVCPDFFERLAHTIETCEEKAGAFECRVLPCESGKVYDPVSLETPWSGGPCLCVRREALQQTGGFDMRFSNDAANIDFSLRLHALGYKTFYCPGACVYCPTPQAESAAQYAGERESTLYLSYKYGRLGDVFSAEKAYLHTLRRPKPFPHVRKELAWRYLRHLYHLWPFLFWRLGHRALFHTAGKHFALCFEQGRGTCISQPPSITPLVSIVVRTCRRPDVLRETLRCLRHQTYHYFEVIVVEDGAEDARNMIEQEFADLPIRYFSTGTHVGRGAAGNFGLQQAHGELCCFLDDDDYFYAEHLELFVAQFERHPQADILFGSAMQAEINVDCLAPYHFTTARLSHLKNVRMDLFLFCASNPAPIQTVMFRRKLFELLGGLHEQLEGGEDWYLWLKYLTCARRAAQHTVDIQRATSVFTVPADSTQARRRAAQYLPCYEAIFQDEKTLSYTLSARQLREFYYDFLADIGHLYRTGTLASFLEAFQPQASEKEDGL